MGKPPTIEHYAFGTIRIDGRTYASDVIVLPDRVVPGWWRKEGHSLSMDDLEDVVACGPRTLVIGTGQPGLMKVPDGTRAALEALGIEVVVEPTADAVVTYGRLAPGGGVAAGFHLTC
jgi:hypothetical protein